MLRGRIFAALLLFVMLAVSLGPVQAAGPIYKDLPDLDGQEISVAVENLYPPFQFENPVTGAVMGYEYDMVNEICARLNCKPNYQTASWDVMMQAVSEGQFDTAVNGISIYEERKQLVDFSDPYINLDQYLLVRTGEDRFESLDEFAADSSLILGVQQGSAGFFVTEGVVPEERRVVYNEFGALVQALINGDVDAVPADASAAAGFVSSTGNAVELIGDPISTDEMGMIFAKGSDLVAPMNAAIASMKQDGFLDYLYYKWFLSYSPETGKLYGSDMPDLDGQEISVAIENLYTPFQFEEPTTGDVMGYEYDMVNEICARLNCKPTYQTASWDVMMQAVSEGQFDTAVNGISIYEERKQLVDFSDPYINLDQYLLVRTGEDRFESLDEFAADSSLILGVQQGSAGFFVTEGVVPEERRVVYNEFGALVQALINGDVDAVPADASAAAGFVSSTGNAVELIGDPISTDEMGMIFAKGSDLVAPMNAAIASMKQDGFLDYLYYKWFIDYVPAAS